jgi:hypothetical protein
MLLVAMLMACLTGLIDGLAIKVFMTHTTTAEFRLLLYGVFWRLPLRLKIRMLFINHDLSFFFVNP